MAVNGNENVIDPFTNITADAFKTYLTLEMARRFKGFDPEVDARIDANASRIMQRPDLPLKFIPPVAQGAPRVPFYLEGEPGVGKTSVVKAAILEFCDITGLNFVENPKDGYQLGPKDFYYAMVNLSGKNNTMDLGGLPTKNAMETSLGIEQRKRATNAGAWLLAELESRMKAVAGFARLAVGDARQLSKGGLSGTEMTITCPETEIGKADLAVQSVITQLNNDIKKHGVGLTFLRDGQEPMEGRLYLQTEKGTKGIRVTAWAPQAMDADATYVSEMLPNRRFAMAKDAKFCLFNFDDVANSSEAVRNVLLEVAQMNRYSGVMDLGNALVTFSGNLGSEDNTNTQSEQSDAEVTRVIKFRIRDTPKDWAKRTAAKYSTIGGDCQFAAFIEKYGSEEGVFRDAIGDMRQAKGIPKPNSRSLENALSMVLPYFQMANSAGVGVTMFSDDIQTMVKGTVGGVVADRYMSFLNAMLTQAIPLAEALLKTGKLDVDTLNKHMGSGAKSSDRDFSFRFGTALADAFVERIALSDEAEKARSDDAATDKLIAESMSRLCTGLAHVEPGVMNSTLSRVMSRLSSISSMASTNGLSVALTKSTFESFAKGFADSVKNNVWPDSAAAEKDFLSVVSGTTTATAKTAKKSKP